MCGEPILPLGQLIMAALDAVVPFVLPLSQTAPAVAPARDSAMPLRRLRLKTPVSSAHARVALDTLPPVSTCVFVGITEEEFETYHPRQRYFCIYNRVRWAIKSSDEKLLAELPDLRHSDVLQRAVVDWRSLDHATKSKIIHTFLHVYMAPQFVVDYVTAQWGQARGIAKGCKWLDASGVLLTYNGPWGVLPQGRLGTSCSEEELVKYVRNLAVASDLWDKFHDFVKGAADNVGANTYALCFEICSETWKEKHVLRLHAHVYLRSDHAKIRVRSALVFAWMGLTPHKSSMALGKNISRSQYAGLYYVLCPKSYSVFQTGSVRPFLDFPVDPQWIFNLVEAQKMPYAAARSELVRTGKGLVRRLKDLDCWHQNMQELVLEEHVLRVQKRIRTRLSAFPPVPEIDLWLQRGMVPEQTRKHFLVLTGPSQMGKTEYVRSLFAVGRVLELNCASLKHVCLQEFKPSQHSCILWDECSPALVAANRKLFQHPACWVDMGHSPTGQHVVKVWLNDAVSIIASNAWEDDLRKLSQGDAQWVVSNSFVFHVVRPLWQ